MHYSFCSTGFQHSAVVSQTGIVHTFGRNNEGQLGLGNNQNFSIPQQIPNLCNIQNISCGYYFTICLDSSGKLWSFGMNYYGQLGIGNTINKNSPVEVENIPPISFISCGDYHSLCISEKNELWAFGLNNNGQLCINSNNQIEESPKISEYNDIQSISCGGGYSMFQKKNGEIYSCGDNNYGQCGIGEIKSSKKPILIPNLPSAICQFSCGNVHSVFLDENGNVYGTGHNMGIGAKSNQSNIIKIPNIAKVKFIATLHCTTIFIDEDNCCWSLGNNIKGQLGTGNTNNSMNPYKIKELTNITNLSSSGSTSQHVLVANNKGQVFAFGNNDYGQLGLNDFELRTLPTMLDEKYSNIIKPLKCSTTKHLNEIMKLNIEEKKQIINLNSQIISSKLQIKSNPKTFQNLSKLQNSFISWQQADNQLIRYVSDSKTQLNEKLKEKNQIENYLIELDNELKVLQQKIHEIQSIIPKEKEKLKEIENSIGRFSREYDTLVEMQKNTSLFCESENLIESELEILFKQKSIDEFNVPESCLALWAMGLSHCQSIFEKENIDFSFLCASSERNFVYLLEGAGLLQKDICCILFYIDYFKKVGFVRANEINKIKTECFVCEHNTHEETICLLNEYEIPYGNQIKNELWTAPLLLYADLSIFGVNSQETKHITNTLNKWRQMHNLHLSNYNQ